MSAPSLFPVMLAALKAAQSALNQIPRTRLHGEHRTSYEVAGFVDAAVLLAETAAQNTAEAAEAGDMRPHVYSLCEAVADLAANFATASHVPGDSRETVRLCIEWAEAFELEHHGREWGMNNGPDYMEAIDDWFDLKFGAWLSSAKDAHENPNARKPYTPRLTEDEERRRGELIARELRLCRKANGRFDLLNGDKTALGLFRTMDRLVNDGE